MPYHLYVYIIVYTFDNLENKMGVVLMILILSVCTQIGMLFELFQANYFLVYAFCKINIVVGL